MTIEVTCSDSHIMSVAINMLADLEFELNDKSIILDFGCGNGSSVKKLCDLGLNAFGCDLAFKPGQDVESLSKTNRISLIESDPYRLPYPDNTFDYSISSQVMEHVSDYKMVLSELRRVMKPGGVVLHFFPSKLRPIESHVYVPFASIIQNYPWLLVWAFLGIRKPNQKGLSISKIALANRKYLRSSTNYLSGRKILDEHKYFFDNVRFVEYVFLKNSPNKRGRILYEWGCNLPFLFWIYRVFWSRVMIAS